MLIRLYLVQVVRHFVPLMYPDDTAGNTTANSGPLAKINATLMAPSITNPA